MGECRMAVDCIGAEQQPVSTVAQVKAATAIREQARGTDLQQLSCGTILKSHEKAVTAVTGYHRLQCRIA